MRERMVGTPEWRAANNYTESTGLNDPMAQGGRLLNVELPFTPFGKTLTTAQKQAQSPLYNPLYDPSSAEYKANLLKISNPNASKSPIVAPQIKMPDLTPQAPESPVVNTSNLTQAYQNQNQTVSNPAIQLPQQFQQNFNATPSITPPTGTQGIKMPKFNRNAGFKTNWSDLFSVAHNRYTR